jgi:hypothetical protein
MNPGRSGLSLHGSAGALGFDPSGLYDDHDRPTRAAGIGLSRPLWLLSPAATGEA